MIPFRIPFFLVISTNIVLTAAHCVVKDYTVREVRPIIFVCAGNVTIDTDTPKIYAEKAYPHELYNGKSLLTVNDIALIKLESSVILSEFIKLAQLPKKSPAGGLITVAGWGITEDRKVSKDLMYVNMPLTSKFICESRATWMDVNSVLCVVEKDKGICFGDSGGPYFIKGTSTVVGIVSFGQGDPDQGTCDTNAPTVGTNVYFHLNWIKKNMKALGST